MKVHVTSYGLRPSDVPGADRYGFIETRRVDVLRATHALLLGADRAEVERDHGAAAAALAAACIRNGMGA